MNAIEYPAYSEPRGLAEGTLWSFGRNGERPPENRSPEVGPLLLEPGEGRGEEPSIAQLRTKTRRDTTASRKLTA